MLTIILYCYKSKILYLSTKIISQYLYISIN
nr:MAG TPA: hypothetical protein [Caudoviricetes sp.]